MKLRTLLLWPCLYLLSQGCSFTPICSDEIAAAFDVGSGSTKLQVASRNSCDLTITKTLLQTSKPVGYAQDLSSSGQNFSPEIIARGEKAIKELMQKALVYQPEKIFGVATQAFRQADNGQEVLSRWRQKYGWPFQLIDQQKEAMLAYELVELKLELSDESNLMVWDIGGGSQQVVTKNEEGSLRVFKSELASVTFKNQVIDLLEKNHQAETPNPMDKKDIDRALKWARQKIRSELSSGHRSHIQRSQKVIGLGGVHGASVKNQLGLKSGAAVLMSELDRAIEERVGLTDEELGGDYASTDLTNLILVKALMLEYGLESYTPLPASLTESLLRQVP